MRANEAEPQAGTGTRSEADMDKTGDFDRHGRLLFSIAYRMLGSVADAEDVLQEAYLRWQRTEEEVRSPRAYLSAVVTRLSIDQLRSARVRREEYIGAWLPEPILTEGEGADAPAEAAILEESLSMAFMVLLESLTPTERAVFLLREISADRRRVPRRQDSLSS